MQHHFPIVFENKPKETLRNNYFAVENIQVIAERNWLTVLQLEHYLFCETITYLQSLVFKVGDVN